MYDNSQYFFTNSTIEGYSFYFYCPNMSSFDKLTIKEYIKQFKGVSKSYNIYKKIIIKNRKSLNIYIKDQ